jgi:hypothetical protein
LSENRSHKLMASLYDYTKGDKSYVLRTECRVLIVDCWVLSAECWLLQAKSVRGYQVFLLQVPVQDKIALNQPNYQTTTTTNIEPLQISNQGHD